VAHEVRVVSAHRTPDVLFEYAASAASRGLRAIIAGAGGAAHLPGMLAAKTAVPVLGVPVQSKALNGMDSLLSIVQMPAGIPVATFAIGNAGAANAALFAAAMLASEHAGDRRCARRLPRATDRRRRPQRRSTQVRRPHR
jgi:5-(carboxyamino)imidazole ribonucleotide mutase